MFYPGFEEQVGPGSQQETGNRNTEFLFLSVLPRELPGVSAKSGICFLLFLSMRSCLAQVSKKLHSTILLNCFRAHLTTASWPWLLGAIHIPGSWTVRTRPVGFSAQQIHFSFCCNAEATQNCSINWVQLAQKEQRNWLKVQSCPRWSCHPPATRTATRTAL